MAGGGVRIQIYLCYTNTRGHFTSIIHLGHVEIYCPGTERVLTPRAFVVSCQQKAPYLVAKQELKAATAHRPSDKRKRGSIRHRGRRRRDKNPCSCIGLGLTNKPHIKAEQRRQTINSTICTQSLHRGNKGWCQLAALCAVSQIKTL